ncbi:MAG: hypothetical protein R2839_00945 [Thermomicrobiales bacterium]
MSGNQPAGEGITLTTRSSREPVPLEKVAVVLEVGDHVAIAKEPLLPGTQLILE